jgi:DNA modification methylase
VAEPRKSTSTSTFGASRRESHDSSAFYARFTPPVISADETVVAPADRPLEDALLAGPAEHSLADDSAVLDNSVALVVTSPPYFVGKTYEEAMGRGHVPSEYEEHLANLHRVFELCVRKLEPGGRIAVNVANLGRRPYRSQAADVLRIFEDLGLLLRGEIIWKKGEGSNGSTAWGSFQKPSNPVFRDITERIIVASKGRFDRAISSRERSERGLPAIGSITKEAFMRDTKDVWEIAPESATRVGHPAPFPVALPGRLIELYTYYGDLVLDPYMGSGTTAVAALRTQRNYIGCESEPRYLDAAETRIAAERDRLNSTEDTRIRVVVPAVKVADDAPPDPGRAVREGKKAEEIAELVLAQCGFTKIRKNRKLRSGVEIDFEAEAVDGSIWHFDVTGAFTSERGGLRRTDSVWKSLGKAAVRRHDDVVRAAVPYIPFVLLTTALPSHGVGLRALLTARDADLILDAVPMLSEEGQTRLRLYGTEGTEALDYRRDDMEFLVSDEPDALF